VVKYLPCAVILVGGCCAGKVSALNCCRRMSHVSHATLNFDCAFHNLLQLSCFYNDFRYQWSKYASVLMISLGIMMATAASADSMVCVILTPILLILN
jgi:hypothetical protein